MPIPVSCQCGYQVDAPDQYAGKQVSCPACQNPLQVPLPQQAPVDAMLDEILSDAGITAVTPGGYRCPNCTASISGGGIICLECGYNVESGQMMGESEQIEKKHFGAAVYTNRSYGHDQLDTAAELMEVELLEKDAEGPTPYWVWLFVFLNVISFGMGLAVFSLTYFALVDSNTKPATLLIANYQGTEFSSLAEDAPRDKYFLVVTEAEITAGPQKSQQSDDEMGMDFSSKIAPGTYCTINSTQNDFSQITPLSGQNSTQSGWIPSMAVRPVTEEQIELLILNSDMNLSASDRPITDNVDFAFYTGLATYCAVQFWLGIIYYVVAHISIALQAVKDEMVHTILASILPVYNVVWCFMRWRYVGGNGIMALLGLIMIIGGIVIQLFVPDLLPTAAGRKD
ncbi:MAG: hypothetical protein VX761_00195 [Planctomycetota bacterium]|nr:hypothetical protein [Planctomycetota bacterium]